MDPVLSFCLTQIEPLIQLIQRMVECESPSDSPLDVNRFAELIAGTLAGQARCRTIPGGRYGKHLQAEFILPGPKRKTPGQILALGHSDTVYSKGALTQMPWRREKGRLWGPGVLDMKGGVAFFIFAMRALRELDLPVSRRVLLQLNSDEEVGSHSSRPLTELEANRSRAVLVLEPGTGIEGKLKTARKGVGGYTVRVDGVSSHAGVDFSSGASAILELARQIEKIRTFTNLDKGITVNPGVIRGGTRSNVIASQAEADVDFRVPRLKDFALLERRFHSLRSTDKRCRVSITGELNRPPMERSKGTVELFRLAQRMGREVGVDLEESSTGGGSDGNFTAALGIPTLDGLGAVGEGAHAPHESILIHRIADRTALLAKLVQSI